MADFMREVDFVDLPVGVQKGIRLHQSVDAFTDSHPVVRELRKGFSDGRRRFSGVVLDVVFDHFLIKHWTSYSQADFSGFVDECYASLWSQRELMPDRMEMVMSWMISRDWFRSYAEMEHIGRALDGLAGRLKMKHGFHGAIQEVEENYTSIEDGFLTFFPELCKHVEELKTNPQSIK